MNRKLRKYPILVSLWFLDAKITYYLYIITEYEKGSWTTLLIKIIWAYLWLINVNYRCFGQKLENLL